jgi:transcriptional regulator
MAAHRKTGLSRQEIGDLLDADDDNVSDLEMDGVDSQEEHEEVTELIFRADGTLVETIHHRHIQL